MKPKEFVTAYWADAEKTFKATGIAPEIILAQAALESGWGEHAPGNMFFGVKDFDGVNGNEQLLTTFEYSKINNLSPEKIGLHSISKIEPKTINGVKFFKYTGEAYFKKYNSPEESFTDHARVFLKTKLKDGSLRYAKALAVKDDYVKFFTEVQAAGYAQSPTYASTLIQICKQIKALV